MICVTKSRFTKDHFTKDVTKKGKVVVALTLLKNMVYPEEA
nr:MAG: hypothetical protein [Microviridae sp.]